MKKTIINKYAKAFFAIIILLCVSACGLSDKQAKEILNENGYEFSSVKVVLERNLSKGVQGTEEGNNKFVLLKIKNFYTPLIINVTNRTVSEEKCAYPYILLANEVMSMGKKISTDVFLVEEKYIEKYGIDALNTRENAEKCLNEITENGIMSVSEAQAKITEAAKKSWKDHEDVTIIFKDNSAVPLYYVIKTTKLVYNWGRFWTEDNYERYVKYSLDSSTKSAMSSIYGEPYVYKTVYSALNGDLEEAGTYNSLEEAQENLKKKN